MFGQWVGSFLFQVSAECLLDEHIPRVGPNKFKESDNFQNLIFVINYDFAIQYPRLLIFQTMFMFMFWYFKLCLCLYFDISNYAYVYVLIFQTMFMFMFMFW